MLKHTLWIFILLVFAFPSAVKADIAPPYSPPGSNPQPGAETTEVRMDSERVLVEVLNDKTPGSLGSARVTADFSMQNTGAEDESMAVRFPVSANDGRGEYPEIRNVAVKVNGKQIPVRRGNYPDIRSDDKDVPWAEFDVTFPAGKETKIQVQYTLQGTGYAPYTAFYYLLETGAGWNDTIGSADIILRLPYPVSLQNVVLDSQIGWAETTRGATFDGNEARWHFEDFEPGPDGPVQNMEFALVAPYAWNAVLAERQKVSQNPKDAEAWGRLGRAYKQIFLMNKAYREDPGGEEIYRLAVEAYEKCLALKPDDAQWHAGFADLLTNRAYWDIWRDGFTGDAARGLYEIHTALELAPKDPIVQEIATNIHYLFPDGVQETDGKLEFLWLTQTPTPFPPTPTIAVVFDPQEISGVYQTEMITLSNEKMAQLVLTLHPDHTALMETMYDSGSLVSMTGMWQDNGDGNIRLTVTDPNRGAVSILFAVDADVQGMHAIEFPSQYGDAGIELRKPEPPTSTPGATETQKAVETSTPEPEATGTPEPPPTLQAQTPAPVEPPSSEVSVCGTAVFVPLAGLLLFRQGAAWRRSKWCIRRICRLG